MEPSTRRQSADAELRLFGVNFIRLLSQEPEQREGKVGETLYGMIETLADTYQGVIYKLGAVLAGSELLYGEDDEATQLIQSALDDLQRLSA